MHIDKSDTAIVFIDPQNEVLSDRGLAWPLVHESLQENNTIENMERLFKAAKTHGFEVFISPHYFYPTDKGWQFNGPLETDETTSGMFARKGVLNLDGHAKASSLGLRLYGRAGALVKRGHLTRPSFGALRRVGASRVPGLLPIAEVTR
jgi:nicotinamidase-related amidase